MCIYIYNYIIYIYTLCIAISVIMAWYGNLFFGPPGVPLCHAHRGGLRRRTQGVAAFPGGPGASATRGGASVKGYGTSWEFWRALVYGDFEHGVEKKNPWIPRLLVSNWGYKPICKWDDTRIGDLPSPGFNC